MSKRPKRHDKVEKLALLFFSFCVLLFAVFLLGFTDYTRTVVFGSVVMWMFGLAIYASRLEAWHEHLRLEFLKPQEPELRISVSTGEHVATTNDYRTPATTTHNASFRIVGESGSVSALGDELCIERERLGFNTTERLNRTEITDVTVVYRSLVIHTAKRSYRALTHGSDDGCHQAHKLIRAWWTDDLNERIAHEANAELHEETESKPREREQRAR